MNYEDLARAAGAAIRDVTASVPRPEIGRLRRRRQRRWATLVAVAAFAGTLAAVGALGANRPRSEEGTAGPAATTAQSTTTPATTPPTTTSPPSTAPPTTATGTTPTTTSYPPLPPNLAMWTIAEDPSWYRADSELMPSLGWESLTMATLPLRAGGSLCAHMPENSLRDMGPEDALFTVFFSITTGGAPWPAGGFDDRVFPESPGSIDAVECAQRSDLEMHWGAWSNGPTGLYVLVAFGDDVADDTRARAWEMLSSLRPVANATSGGVCVVTVPTDPGYAPPEPWPQVPSNGDEPIENQAWYGTPSLWTTLTSDGTYLPRKSVWWSRDFDPSATNEWMPDIVVRYERLDSDASRVVESEGLGTNGTAAGWGWFMIADIAFEPPEPGCWRTTAEYRGTTLSFTSLVEELSF